MGRHDSIRACLVTKSSDAWREGRQRREKFQRRRSGRGRLHGGLLLESARTAGKTSSSSATIVPPLLTTAPTKIPAASPTAGIPRASWSIGISSCASPIELDLAATAPLLCAGITTYSPLRHFKVGKGQKVGVVGLGGLGHMAVKFAQCFRRRGGPLHHFPGKDRGCKTPRRARSGRLEKRRRNAKTREQF